jgi:hypothetical protein
VFELALVMGVGTTGVIIATAERIVLTLPPASLQGRMVV